MSIDAWVHLWIESHAFIEGSPVRMAWPDGRALMRQPAIGVAMFSLIANEWSKEAKAQMEASARSG